PSSIHLCTLPLSPLRPPPPRPPSPAPPPPPSAPSRLSLPDALPLCSGSTGRLRRLICSERTSLSRSNGTRRPRQAGAFAADQSRSEEHTSELQSLRQLVCRLLLEKKKR